MPTTTPTKAPRFWRCTACTTPNPLAPHLTRCLGCGRPIPPYASPEPISRPSQSMVRATSSHRGRGRSIAIAGAVYGVVVLALVAWIRGGLPGLSADPGWASLPRWPFLVPLVALGWGAIWARRGLAFAVLIVDLGIVVGPLMGFVVPIQRITTGELTGATVRVMTLSLESSRIDRARLLRALERHRVDVLCFQENSPDDGLDDAMAEAGWHLDRERGVASRFAIVKDDGPSTNRDEANRRDSLQFDRVTLQHPYGFGFVVGSARLPKTRWDESLLRLRELMADSGPVPLIVGGDFRSPVDHPRMASLRATYPSAFEASGWGFGDNHASWFPSPREDHLVGSRDWSFARCWVGPDLGGLRRPLIAEAILIDRKPAD